MAKRQRVNWRARPGAAELTAAAKFLSLINTPTEVTALISATRGGAIVRHAATDLLRASNLPLLSRDEPHAAADLKRLRKGKALSPVIVIAGHMAEALPLTVADGYHRICAVCHFDESAPVSCWVIGRRRAAFADRRS